MSEICYASNHSFSRTYGSVADARELSKTPIQISSTSMPVADPACVRSAEVTMERAIASRTKPADTVEIRQLRAFLMLAELGRITSVARALGLAQSTVSETLAALERRLGAALIVRRRGNSDTAVLTTVGRTLLPHAHRILAAVEQAQ